MVLWHGFDEELGGVAAQGEGEAAVSSRRESLGLEGCATLLDGGDPR